MEQKYLIDTNIIIYHFKDEIPEHSTGLIKNIFYESFNISAISKIEFLGWHDFFEEQYNQTEAFLSKANVISISEDITSKTIQIKRRQKIKLPDAIIAATCLVHDLTLITRNEKDFEGIKGLTIFNPFTVAAGNA